MPRKSPPKYRVLLSSDSKHANPDEKQIDYIVDETFGYLAMVTSRLIQRVLTARFKKHGVLFGEWPILLFLWARGSASQYELSKLISIGEGTVARVVARMERKKLVARKRNENDKREYIVRPTQKGWSLRDKLLAEVGDLNHYMHSTIGEHHMDTLMTMHRKLHMALEDLLREPALDEDDMRDATPDRTTSIHTGLVHRGR